MSIVNPKITDFKVKEGSLVADWVQYLNGYGEKQKLFNVNPQAKKIVTLNKEGIITPDTGYSFMEEVVVTNSAPVGSNTVKYIKSKGETLQSDGIIVGLNSSMYYICYRDFIPLKDGKVDYSFTVGETYQNLLYMTDSFTVHPGSWAVGRYWQSGSVTTVITSYAQSKSLELNNSGKVTTLLDSIIYTDKSFSS